MKSDTLEQGLSKCTKAHPKIKKKQIYTIFITVVFHPFQFENLFENLLYTTIFCFTLRLVKSVTDTGSTSNSQKCVSPVITNETGHWQSLLHQNNRLRSNH